MKSSSQKKRDTHRYSFSLEVYKAVLEIPVGGVSTYKKIASCIGRPRACRAVGQALKKNPLPFIIPCHRVIASDGTLGGYAFGRKLKQELLNLERQITKIVV